MKRVIALILTFAMVTGCLCACGSKQVSYKDDLNAYVKTMDYHDGFTILQLTDIHWNGGTQIGNDEYGSREYLLKVINEAIEHTGGIDLIEVTGDTFMLANKSAVRSFIDFMEEVGIPYAMGWGNHDRQGKYNPNWISRQFENAPYCLYTEVDNDDVHDRGNYIINLLNASGNVSWQITHIDSGASYRAGASDLGLTYDFIREDQYEWMTAEHDAVGKEVPVICYYHIVQADGAAVYEAIQNGAEGYKSKFFKLENFGASDYASFTEDIFLKNNVKAAFIGHDHNNDWTYTTPSGITYGYGVKTGTELYYTNAKAGYSDAGFAVTEDFIISGASLVTLNNESGDFSLEHLYLNERDEGDFVLWVEY